MVISIMGLERVEMRERESSRLRARFLAWRTGFTTNRAREYVRKILITSIS